jgi:hypothetical protein
MPGSLLFVLGTPRSGINTLSQCLKAMGIKALASEGAADATTINQLLLQDLDVSSYSPALPEGWMESGAAGKAKSRIERLVSELLSFEGILQLTSANPLTLKLWQQAFNENKINVRYFLMLRHPWETALSLAANHNLDLQRGHILWLAHTRAALRAMQDRDYTLITYDQLLADPVSTISHAFGSLLTSDFRPLISDLLDYVQPSLKHHHVSDIPEADREAYRPYADIYNQLRLGHYSSFVSLPRETTPQEFPQGFHRGKDSPVTLSAGLNRLEETSPQGIQSGRIESSSAFTSPDLIDPLLQALGKLEGPLHNTHSSLPIADDSLFAKITLPSSNKQGHITKSFPLLENQWQKVSLTIPDLLLLKDSPIVINPLNVMGTIKISCITIENKSTGKPLWKIQTPQDFDTITTNDDLYRLVDLDNLVLLTNGPNPCLTLPLLSNLPDAPLELSIWMKPQKNLRMLHKTSSSNIARFIKKDSSNLVWLASYPRSGNTWLRIVLKHNFGLKSYSVYNDTGDIGKYIEISEAVGHQYMHWESVTKVKNLDAHSHEQFSSFDSLRYKTSNLKLVKTHSQFHEGFLPDKVIYIYRDGRATLRSFASYLHDFSNRSKELNKLLDELLCGCDTFTLPWHQHILSWKDASHDKVLFLKFEDVVSDINVALKKIADFLEIHPIRTDVLTFDELHAINPDFFRKGQKKSWHDLFDDTRHALFWILNHEAMDLLGYDQDKHPICEILFYNQEAEEKLEPVSAGQLDYFNHLLQHCGNIILAHISSIPERNRQFMNKSLQSTHDKLAAYFSHWDVQGKHRAWIKVWEQIFTELDNNEQE